MRSLIASCIFVLLSACPVWAQEDIPVNSEPFGVWLQAFEKDAVAQGISPQTLDATFADVSPDESVLALDRKQPESVLTLEEYVQKTVSKARVDKGREMMEENRGVLEEIGKKYGVQPEYIVALWGIETSFGSYTGNFNIIEALATLAYDGRRAQFFRGELIAALKILESEHMQPSELQGSWAGALGQCQFMPSTYLHYAVDYDGDGKRDVWNNRADAFASIANYLQALGWNGDEGVRTDGNNYKVLLKWNRSRYFVTAVATLADKIGE